MSETKQAGAIATIIKGGPLVLEGQLQLGEEVHTELSLCRCGHSKNKPFCDGGHREYSFDDQEYMAGEVTPLDCAEEPVTLKVVANGPVIMKGCVTFKNPDDEVIFNRDKGGLCRCGASKNKPFCDGTHKETGFQG